MFDNQFRVCPDECLGEVAYPAIPKDQDCTSFPIYESQVCGLVILPFGAPLPNDWKTKPPWSGSIDNSAAGNSTGKWLRGTGSVGIPQKLEPVFGRGTRFVTQRIYPLIFRVYNLTDPQYDLLTSLQCDNRNFTFWYETLSGHIFGTAQGIVPLICDVDFPLEGNRDSFQYADISIRWRSKSQPERAFIGSFNQNDFSSNPKVWGWGPNQTLGWGPDQTIGEGV